MFLKERHDGTTKERGCADGCKHSGKCDNYDATFPKVSTKVVLISTVIDAFEERDMDGVDIPGSYLRAYMEDDIFLIFRGTVAKLMVAAYPKLYQQYISYINKGGGVFYMCVQKALYGCLKNALLFYGDLVGDLESYGF